MSSQSKLKFALEHPYEPPYELDEALEYCSLIAPLYPESDFKPCPIVDGWGVMQHAKQD